MDGTAGRSTGFGRIGGELRASMYTPVHLATRPGTPVVLPARLRRPGAVGWALMIVAAFVGLAAGLVVKARPEVLATRDLSAAPAPALDPEAERLGRSAFAAHRPRG